MASDDPFDNEKTPSVSWKGVPIGTVVTMKILEEASLVQSTNFETGKPDVWPDGNPKMSAVTTVEIDGERRSLWAPKPSALLAAISEAKRKANAGPMKPGGILKVKLSGEEPKKNDRGQDLNPKKLFQAVYEPPVASTGGDDEPPF